MAKKRRKAKKHKRPLFFGAGQHRPRLQMRGRSAFVMRPHSPYKHAVHRINPLLSEVALMAGNPRHRRRHHRNPDGLMTTAKTVMRDPMGAVMDATLGTLSAYMTIALPNWLLPFPGTDWMSKGLRFATRLGAGGLVVMAVSSVARGSREAATTGALMGAVGGTVLDLLGTRIIIGSGDVAQTPMSLLAPVLPTLTGVDAYTRARLRGVDAYTRPILPAARGVRGLNMFPTRQVVKHQLW